MYMHHTRRYDKWSVIIPILGFGLSLTNNAKLTQIGEHRTGMAEVPTSIPTEANYF